MPKREVGGLAKRCPESIEAEKMYHAGARLIEIAEALGKPAGTVRRWKSDQKWDANAPEQAERAANPSVRAKRAREARDKRKVNEQLISAVEENDQLTEKEKVFCLHFVKSNNCAAAARAAGCESVHANKIGWEMLQKPHIRAEVERLKKLRNMAMLANVDDLVDLHIRIAFADMKEYVKINANTILMQPGDQIDGQLISKIRETEQGIAVELRDWSKSAAFLERYFEANPMDRHKKAFDNARLELERKRLGENGSEGTVVIIDDV